MARTSTSAAARTAARAAATIDAAAADVPSMVAPADVYRDAIDAYVSASGADRARIRRDAGTAASAAIRAGDMNAAIAWTNAGDAMAAYRADSAAPAVDYAAAIATRVVALVSGAFALVTGDARPDGIDPDAAPDAASILAAIAALVGDVDGDRASDAFVAIARYVDGNGGVIDADAAAYVSPRVTRAGGRRDVSAAIADAGDAGAFTPGTRYTWSRIAGGVAATRADDYRPSAGAVRNRFVADDGTVRPDVDETAPAWTNVDTSGATYSPN